MDSTPKTRWASPINLSLPTLACPECGLALRAQGGASYRCEPGHSFPVIDGIPDLVPGGKEQSGTALLTPSLDLTILLPAWNEAENLRALLPRVAAVVNALGVKYECLVVDAGSTDGTPQVAAGAGARVARQTEPGYGGALRMGFGLARGRYIATLDADLSHDPDFLTAMWAARTRGAAVIASRYVPGGRADGPLYRRVLSQLLNHLYAQGLSLPFRDMSSGFRLYRSDVIKNLDIEGRNFDVLEDILLRLVVGGYAVVEVPMHYKPRFTGRSHVRLVQFLVSYLRTFWRLWRLRNAPAAADFEARAGQSLNILARLRHARRRAALCREAGSAQPVLYVGCGSDPLLADLPDAIGMDSRLNKLRWARRYRRPLVRALPQALPFTAGAFTAVVCAPGQGVVPEGHAVEELARVLAPGGRLILDTDAPAPASLRSALERAGLTLEVVRGRALMVAHKPEAIAGAQRRAS
jgi:dolichol-phosphate mannosyltransferase